MEFLIILVFIVFFGVMVALARASSKRTAEAWKHAARKLGIDFQPGGFFHSCAILGNYHGFFVHVDTFTRRSGKNSRTYTRLRVRYPQSLKLGLQLTRAGFFSGVAQFFGAQDIAMGDQSFDDQVVVKGSDTKRVQAFLTPSRRMRISRFLASYSDATITDTSIEWNVRGLISDASRLVGHVEALVRLGWHLAEDRAEDESLSQIMTAQDEGRPEVALGMLAQRHRQEETAQAGSSPFQPVPVEERLLEGELLYLGGRTDEARQVFNQAAREAPDDPELAQWSQALANRSQLVPATAVPEASQEGVAKTPASPAPLEPVTVAPAGQTPLDVASVCDALFGSTNSSFAAYQLFEDRYAGKQVRWSGVLQRVDEFSYDLVFQGQEGCKATLEVHELTATPYGQRRVLAIVQFPNEALEMLRNRTGQQIEFTGRLAKADGLMRNLYLTDGRLVESA